MDEDKLYIEQFLGGEGEGFEALVRKYQNRVLNIIYSLIGRDRESEDVVQETFLKVYHNLRFFRHQCQFSTWLYRIAVNTTYDFLRRRKSIVDNEKIIEKIAISYESARDVLLKKEKEAMVQKALVQVPFKYRIAVVLKDIEGLSYMEIAKVLDCNIGTVESRIFRARQSLREELLKLEGEIL